jgi:hypothetical protein
VFSPTLIDLLLTELVVAHPLFSYFPELAELEKFEELQRYLCFEGVFSRVHLKINVGEFNIVLFWEIVDIGNIRYANINFRARIDIFGFFTVYEYFVEVVKN